MLAGRDVDLVDLRQASTVLRVQILRDARMLLDADAAERARFEATALSAYARLNEERKQILADVAGLSAIVEVCRRRNATPVRSALDSERFWVVASEMTLLPSSACESLHDVRKGRSV